MWGLGTPTVRDRKNEGTLIFRMVDLWRATFIGADSQGKLKADRPHPRNYSHTPTNYRHTDKHLKLVMTPIALYCSAVRADADGRTERRTDRRTDATKYIISLASRSIKIGWHNFFNVWVSIFASTRFGTGVVFMLVGHVEITWCTLRRNSSPHCISSSLSAICMCLFHHIGSTTGACRV